METNTTPAPVRQLLLPNELIDQIAEHLDDKTLLQMRRASRDFYDSCQSPWRARFSGHISVMVSKYGLQELEAHIANHGPLRNVNTLTFYSMRVETIVPDEPGPDREQALKWSKHAEKVVKIMKVRDTPKWIRCLTQILASLNTAARVRIANTPNRHELKISFGVRTFLQKLQIRDQPASRLFLALDDVPWLVFKANSRLAEPLRNFKLLGDAVPAFLHRPSVGFSQYYQNLRSKLTYLHLNIKDLDHFGRATTQDDIEYGFFGVMLLGAWNLHALTLENYKPFTGADVLWSGFKYLLKSMHPLFPAPLRLLRLVSCHMFDLGDLEGLILPFCNTLKSLYLEDIYLPNCESWITLFRALSRNLVDLELLSFSGMKWSPTAQDGARLPGAPEDDFLTLPDAPDATEKTVWLREDQASVQDLLGQFILRGMGGRGRTRGG